MPDLKPHGGLSDDINRNIAESELRGGFKLSDLLVGDFLDIETKSRLYTVEKKEDGFYIQGHPEYCPEPTKVYINGSTWGGSMLKTGFVGRGMHLEFILPDDRRITTSEILEIKKFSR